MITEAELTVILSKRLPRHDIDTSLWIRKHFTDPDPSKVAAYSFQYEDHTLTVRAPYLQAANAAVKTLLELYPNLAINYIRLLPTTFKHSDRDELRRI